MKSTLLCLAASLGLVASAVADAPKASIKGPSKVAPDGTIVLDARASVADRPLRWKLDGPDVPFVTLDQDGRKGVVAIVPSAPVGVYKFTLIAKGLPTGEVEIDADAAIWIVTVEPPAPPAPPTPVPPPPGPTPVPPPPGPSPTPVVGTLHVSLVVDLDALTPELATLREGMKVRDAFRPLEVVYRTYGSVSPDLARLNLSAQVAKAGTPCLIVQDTTGRVLGVEKAPADEAGLIARVKTFRGGTDMADAFPSVLVDGAPRYLACLPPRADFGGLPRFSAANGLISRSSWREVDLSPLGVPVLDQGQHGSCVGHGSTSAYWYAYLMAGGTIPPSGFSPTSLYALINGGWDRGAVVSDAMDALINQGICTMAEVPETVIYSRQIPTSANETRKRFRVMDAFHCDSFDAIGSALQLGFPVSFGITLPGNFNNLDSEGVAGHGWGVLGGHCMCGYGTTKLAGGQWAIRVRNSWGTRWGRQGNCLLIESHFGRNCDAFAIRADASDPMDPNPHPVAIG